MDSIAAPLAKAGFRVLRPQPRGYGKSTGPLDHLTIHDFAKDIAAVIEHEKAGPAILAGHAFGHFVAKATAVDFPKLARGIVLIAASQKKADPTVRDATAIATDPSQPESPRLLALQKVFFAPGHDARPWLQGFHLDVQKSEAAARDATPQADYWTGGSVPILDIQAQYDPYRPPHSRNELIEEFGAKRMTTVLIPNAAHAVIVEQPQAVAEAIIQWARKLK
jgi:pimeloyl-ACP methyl ester carboxylesterase